MPVFSMTEGKCRLDFILDLFDRREPVTGRHGPGNPYMKKLGILVLTLASLAAGPLWSQTTAKGGFDSLGTTPNGESSIGLELQDANRTPAGRAAMAMSNSEYRVTPGDVYTLTFLTAGGPLTSSLIVDLDYNISLSNMGSVAARGLTWRQFVTVVAEKVLKSYPLSAPQLIINSTGSFPVFVLGEVRQTIEFQAWGLSRLSQAVAVARTGYSSTRAVRIVTVDGATKSYDLFQAERFGRMEQDPYLRPGDRVELLRSDRIVTVTGAIRRPGTYQLLSRDGVRELVELYADGLAVDARTDRLDLQRKDTRRVATDGAIRFSLSDTNLPTLIDGDNLTVGNAADWLPVVYVEGAVLAANEGQGQRSIRVPLRAGDTVARLVRSIKASLAPNADLRKTAIVRAGQKETIPVDLERLLYSTEPGTDLPLLEGDRIVIPAGAFEVFVTGEVTKSAHQDVSSLTRLSAFVAPFLTPYSSTRNIIIRDQSGTEKEFDLFRAQRYGEIEQDPYLKMSDTVVVPRLERIVTIQGAVERPGSYQLLAGETLKDLIETYASGFTDRANPNRLTLIRYVDARTSAGEMQEIAYGDGLLGLNNRDSVTIHVIQDLLPVMFIEGAIAIGNQAGEVLEGSNRVVYQFYPGESLTHAVREKRALFGYLSDLENAYLERRGDKIAVDLRKYLFDKDSDDRILLEVNDSLIIPFKQAFVTVGGAVVAPGRYPHVPDRNWRYYVGLAGGIIAEKNSGEAVSILDKEDRPIGKNQFIPPEGKITAASNSFLYYFGVYAPVFTTILSILTTTISVLAVTGVF